MVRVNPYPNHNPNQPEESHSNQLEARIPEKYCQGGRHLQVSELPVSVVRTNTLEGDDQTHSC